MADMMQGAPAPTGEDSAMPPPEAQGGFVIELRVTADGKMSIGVEPMGEESAEDSAPPPTPPAGGPPGMPPSPPPAEPEDNYQPVASLGEAMKLIREIVMHGGESADAGASQDEMSAGYGKDGM